MSVNSPTYYAQQFATDVQLLAQAKLSKLERAVTVGHGHVGEQASPCDQVGLIEASENTERFAPMPRTDAPADRRWVLPRNWDINQLKDKNDLIRQITDERMALARAAVAGMNRRKDLSILDGMFNANQTGKSGTTSTSALAGNVVGVGVGGAASRLNVAKLRNGLQIMLSHELDEEGEEFYIAVDSKANDGLLAETQVTSKDYNQLRDGVPVLRDGKIDRFLGFNFIHTERLLTFNGTDDAAGTSTPIPMWAKSGVYLGYWVDTQTRIDERHDLRGIPWQLYANATFGATRLEEKKVVKAWSRP
jgi:hypothetical protein